MFVQIFQLWAESVWNRKVRPPSAHSRPRSACSEARTLITFCRVVTLDSLHDDVKSHKSEDEVVGNPTVLIAFQPAGESGRSCPKPQLTERINNSELPSTVCRFFRKFQKSLVVYSPRMHQTQTQTPLLQCTITATIDSSVRSQRADKYYPKWLPSICSETNFGCTFCFQLIMNANNTMYVVPTAAHYRILRRGRVGRSQIENQIFSVTFKLQMGDRVEGSVAVMDKYETSVIGRNCRTSLYAMIISLFPKFPIYFLKLLLFSVCLCLVCFESFHHHILSLCGLSFARPQLGKEEAIKHY